MTEEKKSPVQRVTAGRTTEGCALPESTKHYVVRVINESNWDTLYFGLLFDSTLRLSHKPVRRRYDWLNEEAYWIGQHVVAGVIAEEDARELLVCMATDTELPYFKAIIDAAFRACEADFHKNFGVGLRNG